MGKGGMCFPAQSWGRSHLNFTFPAGVRLYHFPNMCEIALKMKSVYLQPHITGCCTAALSPASLYSCMCVCVCVSVSDWTGIKLGHQMGFWGGGGGSYLQVPSAVMLAFHFHTLSPTLPFLLFISLLSHSSLFQSHPLSWLLSCLPSFFSSVSSLLPVCVCLPASVTFPLLLARSSLPICVADGAIWVTFFSNEWHTSAKGGVGYVSENHLILQLCSTKTVQA